MSRSVPNWPPVETEPATPHPDAPPPGTKLGVHYEECFGCGPQADAGLHIETTIAHDMRVISQFTVTKDHQGAPGLAHGGLLACAFDEALGMAVGNLLHRPAVTGRLETDFLRPVPVGTTLHIAAKLDGIAGRKIYASAEGRLNADDGQVALRARGLFVEVRFEHFTDHGDPNALQKLGAEEVARRREWDINP